MPNFSTVLGTDLSKAGSDFGALIQGVGAAVAKTQLALAKTSADSASALATTNIDVIAAEETIYDDAGNIQSQQSFTERLPLIDFIDPTFYQWTQVRLQGMFRVSEIATASNSTTSVFSDKNNSSQHGLLVILGGGQTGVAFTSNDTSLSTTSDQADAVGLARMYAQLNPRTDVGVPKPTRVVQGPSLNIVQGAIENSPAEGVPTSRTLSLLVQLHRPDGTPIEGKAISIETDGTPWRFADSTQTTTDAGGALGILLERTFLTPALGGPPPDTSPVAVVVTARLGLVTNSTTVTF